VGDAARAGLVLAAVTWAVADGPRAAIAFVLVAPAAFGVRLLPEGERVDGMLCALLLTAQLGAAAGLTESTGWWDAAAHAATAALLTALLVAVLPAHSLVPAVAGVVLLGLAWEGAEWASDTLFQTQFAPSLADTLSDLAFDLAGAVAGAAVIAAHANVRRGAHRTP
jgi:VanZ family protein